MILVFKTSVQTKTQIELLRPYLDKILEKSRWNFDLEDCDKILRIEGGNCSQRTVIELLKNLDFECIKLE